MLRATNDVGPVPPGASGGPLKNSPSNRERALNVNHDAQALLKALRSKNGSKAPEAKIADFIKSVETLTKDLLLTPLQTD